MRRAEKEELESTGGGRGSLLAALEGATARLLFLLSLLPVASAVAAAIALPPPPPPPPLALTLHSSPLLRKLRGAVPNLHCAQHKGAKPPHGSDTWGGWVRGWVGVGRGRWVATHLVREWHPQLLVDGEQRRSRVERGAARARLLRTSECEMQNAALKAQ